MSHAESKYPISFSNVIALSEDKETLTKLRTSLEHNDLKLISISPDFDLCQVLVRMMKIDLVILDCSVSKVRKWLEMLNIIWRNYGVPIALIHESRNVLDKISASSYGHFVRLPSDFLNFKDEKIVQEEYDRINEPVNSEKPNTRFAKSIFIKDGYRYVGIDLEHISYLKSEGNYLHIYGDCFHYMIRSTQQEFLKNLPQTHFVKIHRSFIVNLSAVSSISANTLFIGSEELPLQADHKKKLLARLKICL